MYGLKQAGLLVTQLLQKFFSPFGYYPVHHTPGLWLHKTRPIALSIIVDDFFKLLPSEPHLRTRTYAHTYPSTQRDTQLKRVMVRAYSVSRQNLNTVNTTTVP
jgi:hypothetical protein